MTGWLASVFGRKRLVQGAVVGFTISSILCGFAPNLPLLIIFRVIQGATGGTMQPLSQAIMLEAFPAKDRGKAMGFWGLGIVVAPMLGPVLGGWLTDNFSWRWVFYINLPVGLIASLMIHLFVFDPPYLRKGRTGVDYWGIGLLTVGVGALQIMLDKGQQEDWLASNLIRALLVTPSSRYSIYHSGAEYEQADCGSACLPESNVFRGSVADHDGWRCPLRQPRVITCVSADSSRIPCAAGRYRDGAERARIVSRNADGRPVCRAYRSAQTACCGHRRRCMDPL